MTALENTQPADARDLPDFETGRGAALESINDIPVRVSAVLGRTRMSVAELAALKDGSIVELDRKVGEPIDLYVNDRLIARGELVMLDGALGVTMTEIVRRNEF
jgi:flagellar motor switch protein FliN/FliY